MLEDNRIIPLLTTQAVIELIAERWYNLFQVRNFRSIDVVFIQFLLLRFFLLLAHVCIIRSMNDTSILVSHSAHVTLHAHSSWGYHVGSFQGVHLLSLAWCQRIEVRIATHVAQTPLQILCWIRNHFNFSTQLSSIQRNSTSSIPPFWWLPQWAHQGRNSTTSSYDLV